MPSPSEIPVLETLSFVLESVTAPPCRLLEVGCGAGELAAHLGSRGFSVVAIDSDADAVRAARDRGVDARVARWPEHDDALFDAVLFTRSLHHLHPLPPAVARARELLAPSGVVIVEDFAFNDADERTVAWFQGFLRGLRVAGAINASAECFARAVLESDDPLDAWRGYHAHELNPARAMRSALGEHFDLVVEHDCPYLYRYLIPLLDGNGAATRVLREALVQERAMAADGVIGLIGRRFVGRYPVVVS